VFKQRRSGCGGFSGAPLPGKNFQGLSDSDQQAPGSDPDPVDQDLMVASLDWAKVGFNIPTTRV
jgi:hypothetical protein